MKTTAIQGFRTWFSGLVFCLLTAPVFGGVPGAVSLARAEADLAQILERHDDLRVFAASGRSMEPFFDAYTLLLVRSVPVHALRAGMIVVFRDSEGDLVGHRLLRDATGRLRTRGHNNRSFDEVDLNSQNLVGAVVATIRTADITEHSGRYSVVMGKSR